MVGAHAWLELIWSYQFLSFRKPWQTKQLTILELDEAMVGADVELPVLEHDELAAVPALLCPAAAVALVLRQAALRISGFRRLEWVWRSARISCSGASENACEHSTGA